jgi:hypothetical protein
VAADLHLLELLLPPSLQQEVMLFPALLCVFLLSPLAAWHMSKYFLFRRKIAGTLTKVPMFLTENVSKIFFI